MKSPENYEFSPKSLELAKKLEETDDIEFIKQHLGELIDLIVQETGHSLNEDVSEIYEGMKKENCLVRVEQLSRVLSAIELGEKISIGHKAEAHYANSVIPDDEGIKLALAEGQAPGPIRTMVSFGKTLVGFKTDNLSVSEVDYISEADIYRDETMRRQVCRHVEGDISKEDIRFMVMRIPRHLLDEEHLTDEEKSEADMPFVFRAMKF